MGLVVVVLDLPAALRLVHGRFHAAGDGVGIENDHTVGISGGAADGLDEAGLAAEEALLVRVQNGHQAHLRHVQALTQEVDAHQHVELAQSQIPNELHPLDGLHVVVHIPYPDACLFQILGEVLRHLLGEGGHQYPLIPGGPGIDLPNEIVDLARYRPDLHLGVQQTGGPDHLLHHLVRLLPLIVGGGGGDIDGLGEAAFKLLEFQRPVIEGTGQTEAILHQAFLPGPVAVVHGPDLGQRHVALIHKEDKVLGEVIHKGQGRGAHWPVGDNPGVVLDAGAVSQLPHHLHVIGGPLADALGLHQLAVLNKPGLPLIQLLLDLHQSPVHLVLGGDVVAGGVDHHMADDLGGQAGDGVDVADAVDLVAEELHPDGGILPVGGVDLHGIPPDPKHIPGEGDVVALIADLHQTAEQLPPVHGHAGAEGDHHFGEVLRLAQTVDTAHRGYHDHVPPLQQGAGGAQPQAVDLLVGGGVLLDVGVGVGNVGLRLVLVVIGDEVLYRVVGEKLLELLAQLGGQGFVVGQYQGRPLNGLDDLGHGVGLTGTGDAQQHLGPEAVLNALGQLFDGLGLVPGGLIVGYYFKVCHGGPPFCRCHRRSGLPPGSGGGGGCQRRVPLNVSLSVFRAALSPTGDFCTHKSHQKALGRPQTPFICLIGRYQGRYPVATEIPLASGSLVIGQAGHELRLSALGLRGVSCRIK